MSTRIEEILDYLNNELLDFSNYGCYVLLAIARPKVNPQFTHKKAPVFRQIVFQKEDLLRKYKKLLRELPKEMNFYTYITINPRNYKKAWFNLQQEIAKINWGIINGDSGSEQRIKRVDKLWHSELQNKRNKNKSLFLFDLDSEDYDVFLHFSAELSRQTDIVVDSKTKNGWHIVCEPFNPNLFQHGSFVDGEGTVELKKDALLFVDYVEN